MLAACLGVGALSTATPNMVYAADSFGLDETAKQTPFANSKKSLPQLAGSIISAGLGLIGVIFLGLAVYGGFRWMTARGDEKSVEEGRETLINATIGIILIVAAYSITNFLFTNILTTLTS